MKRRSLSHRARFLAALLTSVSAMALVASSAGAVILPTKLQTFKASIDVKLDLAEDSNWKGIKPGCFAPQEEFNQTLRMKIDSTPGKGTEVKNGTASITPASFGVTPSYGDKGSFKQSGDSLGWTLETQYPAGCGKDPAPPVPEWASSPTCKKTTERVSAVLLANSIDDVPDAQSGSVTDGVLMLTRTRKAKPTITAGSIGASCYRTLHDIFPVGRDSLIEITPKSTLMTIPVPKLESKLGQIAKGSRTSRPSFTIPIRVTGTCQAMRMSPSTGPREDFSEIRISQPHQVLGNIDADPDKSTCTIEGKGRAIVRREGPTVTTSVKVPL